MNELDDNLSTVHQQGSMTSIMVLGSMYRLLQTVRIHQDNNKLVLSGARGFSRDVARVLVDSGEATIQMQRGQLFFQGNRVVARADAVHLVHNLQQLFDNLGISGIRLLGEAASIPPQDLAATFRLFMWGLKRQNPFEELTNKLIESGVFWMELLSPSEEVPVIEATEETKDQAIRTYGVALASLKSIGKKVASRKKSGVGKIVRVVQRVVDMIMEDEKVVLGLSTIRDYDDSIYTHSINVSILAMTLGYRIGLSRKVVHRLGICGMFYDFGKLSIPKEVLHKYGKLSKDELAVIHMHPHVGVRQIVQLNAARETKVYSLLASFEHHLRYDRSGYPESVGSESHPSMFGRILAIADVYVALTSYRPYRAYTLSPDSAIGVMIEGSGHEFDPLLLKVFVNMMGVYPIGTLLQLDSNELAMVIDTPSGGAAEDRPRVLILQADGKGGFSKKEIRNLAERHKETGEFVRNIISSMNAAVYGIQPMEFLF